MKLNEWLAATFRAVETVKLGDWNLRFDEARHAVFRRSTRVVSSYDF
jgi:hypothetical protein